MNVLSAMRSVADRIAPNKRSAYKRLVFAVGEGKPFDEAEAGDCLQGRTVEQFRKDVEVYKRRRQAAIDFERTPEEAKQLAEMDATERQLKEKADRAANAANEAIAAYQQISRERNQTRILIDSRIATARNYLFATQSKTWHDERRSAASDEGALRQQAEQFAKIPEAMQSAEESLLQLEQRQKALKDSEGVDAATERAFIRAQIATTKHRIKELRGEMKKLDEIRSRLAKIESKVSQVEAKTFDPEYMDFDFETANGPDSAEFYV